MDMEAFSFIHVIDRFSLAEMLRNQATNQIFKSQEDAKFFITTNQGPKFASNPPQDITKEKKKKKKISRNISEGKIIMSAFIC